jgi:cell wall-associated NlpC family hydrolase
MNIYKHTIQMMGIAAVFLLFGCAPSSNTIRYKAHNSKTPVTDTTEQVTLAAVDSSNTDEISDANDSDDLPDEEATIDISSIMQKVKSQANNQNSNLDQTTKESVLMEIIKYLNTPYRFGGNSMDGIDCSAFTGTVFDEVFHKKLLRSAREQYTQGLVVEDKQDLQFGDLIFFNTRRRVRPGHVGIYIGDNMFAHASSKHGVIVSSLDMDYYSERFMGGRRMEGLISGKL